MKVLVVIPAYNEEASILRTVAEIQADAPYVDFIVVNDCSTDTTRQLLKENQIPYLDLPVNLGIGGGVQTGYRYALEQGYDIAVQFDGDGQHIARYIGLLIEPIEQGKANMVIGSRFITNQGFQSSAMRRLGISFLSRLITLLCGVHVRDVTSGMRAADYKMIKEFSMNYAQDYPEPEAILAAGVKGARIMEVPVEMRERQGGVSSINFARSAYYMVKVSLALIISRISAKKEVVK